MCLKCNDTGKLPIKDYTHGFYNCDCTPQEYGTFRERELTDFDFPCSDTFRGFYKEEPTTNPQATSQPEQVIVHRHSNMSPQESGLIQHISKVLEQHIGRKKARYEGYADA